MNDSKFLVSGWDDDLEDIDENRNPCGIFYIEFPFVLFDVLYENYFYRNPEKGNIICC